MTPVSAFLYRLPRFHTQFPVEFEHDATLISGNCINLSHAGILAHFLYPLGEGVTGALRLKPANRVFALRATVSHSEGLRSGLHFLFADSQQEQVVRALVEIISSQSASPLGVPPL